MVVVRQIQTWSSVTCSFPTDPPPDDADEDDPVEDEPDVKKAVVGTAVTAVVTASMVVIAVVPVKCLLLVDAAAVGCRYVTGHLVGPNTAVQDHTKSERKRFVGLSHTDL